MWIASTGWGVSSTGGSMHVRPSLISIVTIALSVLASSDTAAQKKPKALPEIPGQAAFRCTDSAYEGSDGICADGIPGIYMHDGEGVLAALREGDREFKVSVTNVVDPQFRHFVVRFPESKISAPALAFECSGPTCYAGDNLLGRVIQTTVIPSAPGSGGQNAGAATNLLNAAGDEIPGGLTSLAPGSSTRARFLMGFPDPDGRGYRWAVYYNSYLYPGTGHVTVTRGSNLDEDPAMDACTWTIEAGATDVAGLILFNVGGKRANTQSFEGRFSMPFKITFQANPTHCP
jgi:hypothetical protein